MRYLATMSSVGTDDTLAMNYCLAIWDSLPFGRIERKVTSRAEPSRKVRTR